jgi:hypothetical protein
MSRARLYDFPIGTIFGRLETLAEPIFMTGHNTTVLCYCECGVKKTVCCADLAAGKTRSCGCLLAEVSAERRRSQANNPGMPAKPPWKFLPDLLQLGLGLTCDWCGEDWSDEQFEYEQRQVDHAHNICEHTSRSACLHCVRGVVHRRCNQIIGTLEESMQRGWVTDVSPMVDWYLQEFPLRIDELGSLVRRR